MTRLRWTLLVTGNVLAWCVLGLYQTGTAAPGKTPEPFANAVQQRAMMVQELQKLNSQLAEQNALLRSGKLQVIVESSNK